MPDSALPSFDRFDLDLEEKGIRRLLADLIGDGPAALFRDACILVRMSPRLPSTRHLVGHLAREVEGNLEQILAEEGGTHRDKKLATIERWGASASDPEPRTWLDQNWHKWAHRNDLGLPRTWDAESQEAWAEAKRVLRWILDNYESEFLTYLQPVVTEAVSLGVNGGGPKLLKGRLPPTPVAFRYLFRQLREDSSWLRPLAAEGFFSIPPTVRTLDDGSTVFPAWAQSEYLLKCAPSDPTAVCDTILQIPETENPWVLHDYFEVAAVVPTSEAKRLLGPLCHALRSNRVMFPWESIKRAMQASIESDDQATVVTLVLAALGSSEGLDQVADDELAELADLLENSRVANDLEADRQFRLAEAKQRISLRSRVHGGWVGARPPRSLPELRELEIDELACITREWQPPAIPTWDNATEEGLARAVATLIAENPVAYADRAELFVGSSYEFGGWFLSAFRDVIDQNVSLPWDGLLGYVEWAVAAAPEPCPKPSSEHSGGVSWVRKEAAGLIESAMRHDRSGIPLPSRSRVWAVLSQLLHDEDPTERDEQTFGGLDDPFTFSLNCVRGRAVHALFAYIGWVTMAKRGGPLPVGELVPEAAAAIDELLNPQVETSHAVRSAIAVFFPWLVAIDGEWGLGVRDKVFPAEADEEQRWRVAWASYVCWTRPSVGLYSLLHTRYERALGDAIEAYPSSVAAQYAERMAEHVGLLMLWGAIDPGSDSVATFLNGSDSVTARFLMHFLGRCFGDVGDAQRAGGTGLSDDLVARMVALWDERMAMYAKSESTEDWSELSSFGLWFASGLFEPTWATDILSVIGSLGHEIDRPDLVRGQLRSVFDEDPLRALNCLESLLASGSASVLFRGRRDEVSEMLALAGAHASEDVVAAGARLRNRLVARGFLSYAESDADG